LVNNSVQFKDILTEMKGILDPKSKDREIEKSHIFCEVSYGRIFKLRDT